VAASYLVVSGIFAACAKFATSGEMPVETVQEPHGDGVPVEA
jgi:hypothetical protein